MWSFCPLSVRIQITVLGICASPYQSSPKGFGSFYNGSVSIFEVSWEVHKGSVMVLWGVCNWGSARVPWWLRFHGRGLPWLHKCSERLIEVLWGFYTGPTRCFIDSSSTPIQYTHHYTHIPTPYYKHLLACISFFALISIQLNFNTDHPPTLVHLSLWFPDLPFYE